MVRGRALAANYSPNACLSESYTGDCTIVCDGHLDCVSLGISRVGSHGRTLLVCKGAIYACAAVSFVCDDPSKCYISCIGGYGTCATIHIQSVGIKKCCSQSNSCVSMTGGVNDNNCYTDVAEMGPAQSPPPSPSPPLPSPPPASSVCPQDLLDYYGSGMYAKAARTWRNYSPTSYSQLDVLGNLPGLPSQEAVQAEETAMGVDFCPACTGTSGSATCGKIHNAAADSWEGGHLHLKNAAGGSGDQACVDDSTADEVGARVRAATAIRYAYRQEARMGRGVGVDGGGDNSLPSTWRTPMQHRPPVLAHTLVSMVQACSYFCSDFAACSAWQYYPTKGGRRPSSQKKTLGAVTGTHTQPT